MILVYNFYIFCHRQVLRLDNLQSNVINIPIIIYLVIGRFCDQVIYTKIMNYNTHT